MKAILRKIPNPLRQPCRFLFVGGGATLLDLAAFAALIHILPLYPTVCFVSAFALSVFCRFLADKSFTFQNKSTAYGRQFFLYILGCTVTMLVGIIIFNGCLWLGVSEMWSKLISIPFVTVAGYLLFRFIVFRR